MTGPERKARVDPFPDLDHMSDDELARALADLEEEETACSLHRKMLHGRIDMLRPALVERLKRDVAEGRPLAPTGPGRAIYHGTGVELDRGLGTHAVGAEPFVAPEAAAQHAQQHLQFAHVAAPRRPLQQADRIVLYRFDGNAVFTADIFQELVNQQGDIIPPVIQ